MKQPHILCNPEDVHSCVILPGDPARVHRIARYLEQVREVAVNREFTTVNGLYGDLPVTVMSTGIGGASMVIAIEELIQCGATHFIRVGSSGACQPGIAIGDLVISTGAVREDGASRMYIPDGYPAVADMELAHAAVEICHRESFSCHAGITRSHDSFYVDDETERMDYWNRRKVLASDMETSALYVLASLRGARALSILNNIVLYKEDVREGIGDYVDSASAAAEGERREIITALETLHTVMMA